MSKLIAVPLEIHLPPNAQLPRLRQSLVELCDVLDKALAPVHSFRRIRENRENDVKLAVGLHAMNAVEAARAVHSLSDTAHAETLVPHSRALFEALIKIRWMRRDPERARAYLESEPFERHLLATKRVQKTANWADIIRDCEAMIAGNPALAKLPKVFTGKNNPLNYNAVARALRMPSIEVMCTELGMDEDDRLIDHGVPSLYPHTSVVYTKSFMKGVNADGTARLSTEMDPNMLQAYVARTATRTGEVLNEVLELFPDGAVMFESEKIAERLAEQVTAVSMIVRKKP